MVKEVVYIDPPALCDMCNAPITTKFIDGRTTGGPWANMCPRCHRMHGMGLSLGKGQAYIKQGDHFVKVAG